MWDATLSKMRQEYSLPIKLATRDGQLMCEHENGSSLWIVGCHDKGQIEKFRGEPLYRVAVDEAQAFPEWLRELVDDALEPATADYGGDIALCGTPSPTPIGYFYDATTGNEPGYSNHSWTLRDNPYLLRNNPRFSNVEEFLADLRERHRWGEDNPTYRREWIGLWVDDVLARIYPFTIERNMWMPTGPGPFGLPDGDYQFGIGVDLGFSELTTAFALVAANQSTGTAYGIRAYGRSRMIPTALAAHVQQLQELVRQESGRGALTVVDEGALGKGYAEQMRAMGVGCEAAEKKEKRAYQEFVQGLILSGSALVDFSRCGQLIDESRQLQFDPETGQEDERFPNHACDAYLYTVRKLFPTYRPEQEAPQPGTPEWFRAQQAAWRKAEIDKQLSKRKRSSNLRDYLR
jgi:hypothetical protein